MPAGHDPVIGLGIDTRPNYRPASSRDGRFIAWGNADGSVTVCDLPRIRERLRTIDLGW